MRLKPITPFEPISTETIPRGDQWIAQVKWDGVRILTYYDGTTVQLFNRRKNERTLHYPELRDIRSFCTAKSVILDGEMIALGEDGKPSFQRIMQRDGLRKMERVAEVRRSIRVTYMVFDVIFYNGKWIHQEPLEKRIKLLENIIEPGDHVQRVPVFQDGQSLFQVVKEQNMEGIVLKDVHSRYAINGKDKRWQKKKVFRDLVAVIGGITYRSGVVNALLLGLYDHTGQFRYIGHVGTGKITRQDWRTLTNIAEDIKIDKRPFVNRPERDKDASWVQPVLTVKIQFLEWTESKTLRQPSIQSFVNAEAKDCTFDQ